MAQELAEKVADAPKAPEPAFITVEGIDGCGKSTQARLACQALERAGYDVLALREPGGAAISEKIRALLLDPANSEMGGVCELLLYEAARAQLVHEVIEPALAAGKVVVCDRFYDSTTCYQAFAGGLDRDRVRAANELAVGACRPLVTFVFDIDAQAAAARRSNRTEDRMEAKGLAFQARVAEGYRAIAAEEPARVKLIDAARTIDAIHADVVAELRAAGFSIPDDTEEAGR